VARRDDSVGADDDWTRGETRHQFLSLGVTNTIIDL
jgi:hypothetical protein